MYLQCMNKEDYQKKEFLIYGILDDYPGENSVTICLKEENMRKELGRQFGVNICEAMLKEMKELLGDGKVLVMDQKLSMRGNS